MTHPVKWFAHDMPGAPDLNGVAGSIINVLDACLINGWGLTAVDSISYDNATGIATATVSGGHVFVDYQVIRIEGADQAALNGDQRVTGITSTTFSFEPATDPGVADATGTISAKVAPADWERPFDNGQGTRAVYKPGTGAVTTCVYCIDDTHTVNNWNYQSPQAKIFAAESAAGIDTFGPQFENLANSETYGWIRKTRFSPDSDTPTEWTLIADNRLLYLFTRLSPTETYAQSVYAFGEIESYLPGDLWSAICCAGNYSENPSYGQSHLTFFGSTQGVTLSRKADQLGSVVSASFNGHRASQSSMGGANGYQYPNPADNGLLYSYPVQVSEYHTTNSTPTALRGYIPGIAYPLHDRPLSHRSKTDLTINGNARKHLVLLASRSTSYGQVLIDIDGPWRA